MASAAPWPRQITMPASHRSVFNRPYALSAAQPTASKRRFSSLYFRYGVWHMRHAVSVCTTMECRRCAVQPSIINTHRHTRRSATTHHRRLRYNGRSRQSGSATSPAIFFYEQRWTALPAATKLTHEVFQKYYRKVLWCGELPPQDCCDFKLQSPLNKLLRSQVSETSASTYLESTVQKLQSRKWKKLVCIEPHRTDINNSGRLPE